MNEPQYPEEYQSSENKGNHNLVDYLQWTLRYFWILLISMIGGFILGQFVFFSTPPQYQSSATIEILRFKQDDADVNEEEKIRMGGYSEMLSASEKLKVPHLYTNVATSPLFADRENVVPRRFTPPWRDNGGGPPSNDLDPTTLGNMMAGWVKVKWRTDTTLLDISATHSDPAIARDVLVGLLEEYESSTESRLAGTSEYALEYILKSSTKVKSGMLVTERAIRLYQRCTELTKDIQMAEKQVAEMEKRYLPKWPALVEGKELVEILKQRFNDELLQVINLSDEEKMFWEEQNQKLGGHQGDGKIDALMQLVSTRHSVLMRDLETDQQLYDNLLTKLKEGGISRGFQSKQFDIIQPPSLPSAPVAPSKVGILGKYTVAGTALGLGLIFVIGIIDPTIRRISDLERLTALPVIGAIPTAGGTAERTPESLVMAGEGQVQAAEAIRTLRAGLTFLGDIVDRKTFLITSALPQEGKSWVAANLALSFALQGDKTLLLDCDLRRSCQGEIFGYDKHAKGFSDILSLHAKLEDLLMKNAISDNLFVLPAGSLSANPSELLSTSKIGETIDAIGRNFTRVIIDTAPLVPVSDTLPLAKSAQSVVLVCRIGKTPRGAISRALKLLEGNHSRVVGVVANGLPKTRSRGGYGYYYSYNGGGTYPGYGYEAKK